MESKHFIVVCKAKELKKEITFAWLGIGAVWELDETNKELMGRN